MRIVLLTPVWRGSKGGGILTYTTNLVRALEVMGHTVDVHARFANRATAGQELKVVQPVGGLFVAESLRRMFAERYDAVLCNEGRFTYPAAALYSAVRQVPAAYVVHTFVADGDLEGIRRRAYRLPLTLANAGRTNVVFVSERLRQHVAEDLHVPAALNALVIRAGAPPAAAVRRDSEAVRAFRRTYGISDADRLILGQGLTIVDEKARGAAVLIRALGVLRDAGEPYKLMLTRRGHPIHMLRALTRELDLENRVVFTEEIEDPILAVQACDVYAHIVMNEGGVPLSLLEAMAVGKPIVATPRGGIPEVVRDEVEGLLVEPEQDAVVAAIRHLRTDAMLRDRLAAAARQRAMQMTWASTAQRFAQLLSPP